MPTELYSLRLQPNVFKPGAKVAVKPEFFHTVNLNKPCKLKLVEVDAEGLSPTDVATFSVKVSQGYGTSGLKFTAATREGEAPTPAETTPQFTLTFPGVTGEHVIAIDKPRDAVEGRFFELGFVVLDPSGKEVYPAGKPISPSLMDCGSVGNRYAKLNCKALNFSNDSAVVLSDGVYVLYGVLDYARAHKDSYLLILGHTDSVGDPASNDKLSDDRAKAVLHLLRGSAEGDPAANRDGFIKVCKGRWAARDVQLFLTWASTFSWAAGLAPGLLVSDRGEDRQKLPRETAKAILEFDGKFKEHFKNAAPAAEPTASQIAAVKTPPDELWGQMFDVYSDFLRQLLSLRSPSELDSLLKSTRWADASSDATKAIGCGERYPLVKETAGKGSLENRRTEFVFFVAGTEKPELKKDKLGPLYDAGQWAADPIPCPDDKPPPELTFTLPKTKDVLFVIDVSGSMGSTDGLQGIEANTRLSRVKRALVALLSDHKAAYPDALINVMAFGGPRTGGSPDAVLIETWKETLTKIDAAATTWVNGLQPRGTTPTGDALLKALRETKGPGGAAPPAELTMVVLSDGVPNNRPNMSDVQTRTAILQDVSSTRTRLHPKWIIDSYGFVTGDGGRNLGDFMQKLATQNGGTYTPL